MNFCEKTKLHRSFDAVYIAIFRHVLRREHSEGGLRYEETRGCFFFAAEGGNGLFTFFLHGNIQTRTRPKLAERESSLITKPKLGKLFSRDRTRLSRLAPSGLSMRKYASGFYVLLRDEFTRMKSLNDSILSVVSGSIKNVCFVNGPRERKLDESSNTLATCEPSLAARLQCYVMTASLTLTLTLNWRQSTCCTGARKLSTPLCPNFLQFMFRRGLLDGLIKISLMSTVGWRPTSYFSLLS